MSLWKLERIMYQNLLDYLDIEIRGMRNVQGRLFLFCLIIFQFSVGRTQQIQVNGGFVEDSLKLGANIHYWLKADYPSSMEVIMPDTTYSFSPFEFGDKTFFPSTLAGDMISDSAVYALQSYEIDAIQYLSLPVYIIANNDDSVQINAQLDSIYFQSLAPVVSDTTQLLTNTRFQNVSTAFNYPVFWIVIIVLIILLIVGYLIFGQKIRRNLLLRKLKKAYIKYSDKLTVQIRNLREDPEQELAVHALSEWKIFMELLEKKPFSKLTTKEIMKLEETNELQETLKNIDRCVYGGIVSESLFKDFQSLEDYTQYRYSVITDELKNGK
jgi:hypothetical protein